MAKKIFLSLMTGLTAGTVLGIMLTSEKGVSYRNKLMQDGNRLAENQRNHFNEFFKEFSQFLKKAEFHGKKNNGVEGNGKKIKVK